MCGIAGFLEQSSNLNAANAHALALTMARAIAYRGPDGDGAYAEPECGLGLGHRRLSIVDLSDAGSQPMRSRNGRWVIVFNGEIYNFEEIRADLEREAGTFPWAGHCDTEVLIEGIARWGIEGALKRANGMFAFCAWDRAERILYLARDRMGEKPLYYGWQSGAFLFGSEMKALAAHPRFNRAIDPIAVSEFLTYGYVPTPLSIFRDIKKLPPGHWIAVRYSDRPGSPLSPQCYWTLPTPNPIRRNEQELIAELDALLRDSIRLRMRADVPMGAFLSGGIDSSTIVSLMQAQSSSPIRTFSIGFHESGYDESKYAAQVAAHLGTRHTELHLTEKDALDVVPKLPILYDEPFSDSSQVPTYLLAQLTRRDVTVSLSGDAGDELFAGYTRYFTFGTIWSKLALLPISARKVLASAMENAPDGFWLTLPKVLPFSLFQKLNPQRAKKMSLAMASGSEQEFYKHLVSQWSDGVLMPRTAGSSEIFFNRYDIKRDFVHPIFGMSFVDMGSYLPDDILVKVDRATMAVSLEARIPFLDHRIVEFASRLPLDQKVRGSTGKWLLRRVLDHYVPNSLVDRPKMGFGIPIAEWLRGALREWGDDLLFGAPTLINELINMDVVRQTWREHQAGRSNEQYRLWSVLMLVAWAREWHPV